MHPLFEAHDPGPGHPERPARYAAVRRAVARSGTQIAEAPMAPRDALERVHPAAYLEALNRLSRSGGGPLDADTAVGPESFDAACHAAGAAAAAVDAILAGELTDAFCAGRPPGHHATATRAMGFCIVNHAAVAAAHARAAGAARVAVLDWDAHHGNGTEAIFAADPDVLYVSLHQYPHYPGTGAAGDRGCGAGEGATVNVPLPAGTTSAQYRAAFERQALPALTAFDPELLVVSAGFDAHRADPLCALRLEADDFAALATAACAIGRGRVFVLEGGYDLAALEDSVGAVLAAVS